MDLVSVTETPRPLVLKFGGSLVEQLGAQLYPSVTATVAELISNAWDADAENVWVSVPFEQNWNQNAELVVLDDGHGMTYLQAQEAYLVVGRRKRVASGDRSEGGRLVHGRKGIGKLAAFGTAGYLECTTVREGAVTAFGLDYDELRLLNPDQDYFVDPVVDPDPLVTPSGDLLSHGTRVRLRSLRVKRRISADTFQVAMSRRFALTGMNVFINGVALQRFDIPLQFKLPRDLSPDDVEVDEEGWAKETLPSGDEVRWWIGFTEKPLRDSDQQGVSVLARDKMAQRPFKFERSQGTTSQLAFEYLVGEVQADWLDQGDDIDSDYIQSNRDQLQLENARLDEFVAWGRTRLTWALRAREKLKDRLSAEQTQKDEKLDAILSEGTAREKRALLKVADRIARLPEIQGADVRAIMQSVVDARSDSQIKQMISEIAHDDQPADASLWALIGQFGAMDAKRVTSLVEARLATLSKIQESLGRTQQPGELAMRVRDDLWLLDPRWDLLSQEVHSPADNVNGQQLFVLIPHSPAPVDEVIVVQIHDPSDLAGSSDLEGFARTVNAVARKFSNHEDRPLLRGLYIADNYRSRNETIAVRDGARIAFMTWNEALERSRLLHEAWLATASPRAYRED